MSYVAPAFPPSLRFGEIDQVLLNGRPDQCGSSVTVCIYKSTLLQNKDRVACQVFDGGTAYEMPAPGVAYGVRLVMRTQAMDLSRIRDGLIIKLAPETTIHTLKSGEKVFDCYHCDVMDDWPQMKSFVSNVINNPLSKPGAPTAPVYDPHAAGANGVGPNDQNVPPHAAESMIDNAAAIGMAPSRVQPAYQAPTAGNYTGGHPIQQPGAITNQPSYQSVTPQKPPQTSNRPPDVPSYGPERAGRGGAARSDAEPYSAVKIRPASNQNRYLKLSDLSSYVDKWRVLARVTFKSDIREYRNARGEGKLFSIDLIDADGVEIKGTFFNDAVDRFHPMLKKNSIYSFSKGQVKAVNPRFKKFDHLYELTFGLDAEIEPQEEDMSRGSTTSGGTSGFGEGAGEASGFIPLTNLNARPLSEVESLDVDSLVDVVCICYQVYETSQITVRSTGNRKDKRSVICIDQSSLSIPVTVWGSDCAMLPPGTWGHQQAPPPPPAPHDQIGQWEYYLTVKKAKIDEFNGRRLSSSMGSLQVFPYDTQSQRFLNGAGHDSEFVATNLVPSPIRQLQQWLATQKHSGSLQVTKSAGGTTGSGGAGAPRVFTTIADMLSECQTSSHEQLSSGVYFNIVASVADSNITPHRKYFWPACPTCGKKLQGGPDPGGDPFSGSNAAAPYTCAQCEITVEEPDRKYIFTIDAQDFTNTVKLSVLGDSGKELLDGQSANELEELKSRRGPNGEEFTDVVQGLRRAEFIMKVVARNETWQDETRIKYRLIGASKLSGEGLVSYLGKQKDLIDQQLGAASTSSEIKII